MRRLLAIALLAALPAAAQSRGIPPSVTSITPARSIHGVPASVTSLGPNGFGNSCCGVNFSNGFFFNGHFHHHHFVPVFVPVYPYYPYYPSTYSMPPPAVTEANEEEPPARTIYERRSRTEYSTDEGRYGEHYTDSREQERRRRREEERAAEEAAAAAEREKRAEEEKSKSKEKPEDQEPASVLVFKDGHHQDVSSYAITGEILYDLAHGRAKKILLADLDLPATIKLNDQFGNDFRLPSRPKQN